MLPRKARGFSGVAGSVSLLRGQTLREISTLPIVCEVQKEEKVVLLSLKAE
jgi:hypothetical protein